ncbi:hypothetical protein Rhal01_01478 [Rubritalea halochordaticola]|uniref:Uncharacterized protein n=2 Tax=Rubritalea halochordaticola TaxID=714537 RepID=A0ABP9UXX0_9BACT
MSPQGFFLPAVIVLPCALHGGKLRAMVKNFALAVLCLFMPLALQADDLSLDLTCKIPEAKKSLKDVTVVARLYEFDPLLADVAATEVDKVVISGMDIRAGKMLEFSLPLHAERAERRSYYVTVFIHPDADMKERLYFINGFQKVFEGKDEESLKVELKAVSK